MEETADLIVLAIDDNQDNLTSLQAVLADRLPGARFVGARNGPEGIDLAIAEDPDVILLDIVMPGMDGYAVCRKLKEDIRLAEIPVVFLTALRADRAGRIKALEAGGEGFLPKPFDAVELAAQIRTMAKVKAANRNKRSEKERLAALVAHRTGQLEAELAARKKAEKDLIASNARLEALWSVSSLAEADTQTVSEHILASITKMTGSRYGFYGFVDDDEAAMTIYRWSGRAMKECAIDSKPQHFPVSAAGIWAEAVRRRSAFILNDYNQPHPARKGLPEGHVPVRNLMAVPFFTRGRITALAAVANKPSGFDQTDVTQITSFLNSIQAIVSSKQAEEKLRQTMARLEAFIHHSPLLIAEYDLEGRYRLANQALCGFFNRPPTEIVGKTFDELLPADTVAQFMARVARVAETRAALTVEDRLPADTGERCFITTVFPLFDGAGSIRSMGGIAHEITERKRAEEDREQLQTQLLQAQKMEAVGRLAGGVAHDFNNMLGVILGYSEMVLEQVDPAEPFIASLQEIQKAAKRSADLTRQLLAFARKQEIHPKVLDLNQAVEGILKILRRLIGEDIELWWHPGADLWPVHMDPAQVDQILANLCVNARDAIAGVGQVAIETRNVRLDADDCAARTGFVPGDYVQLIVGDDGCGMTPETLANLFEPFFTTKQTGEGTGLGLATVYGIVKQNNGLIDVRSRPGRGTAFRVYLPRHAEPSTGREPREAPPVPPARGESVLIVEDETPILTLTANILKRLGYCVLQAATPGRAMDLVKSHAGRIHLLITDVVMPEMNGRELADRLQKYDPDLKVLFMSGYTADLIARRGVLEASVHFIQKPFSRSDLAVKVREALEDRSEGEGSGESAPKTP